MMFSFKNQKIWLVRHRVDFRKAHNGLLAEAYRINLNPFSGDVIIFIGKNRRRIKVLHADETGLWVSAKIFTMEAMKTNFKFVSDPGCDVISTAELAMLIEGTQYTVKKKVKTFDMKKEVA
jgi:hypothetical protein